MWSNSDNARCHCPPFSHAEIAALKSVTFAGAGAGAGACAGADAGADAGDGADDDADDGAGDAGDAGAAAADAAGPDPTDDLMKAVVAKESKKGQNG